MKRQHFMVGASVVLNFVLIGVLFSHSTYHNSKPCPDASNSEIRQINSQSHIKVNTVYEDSAKKGLARDVIDNWNGQVRSRFNLPQDQAAGGLGGEQIPKFNKVEIHSEHKININGPEQNEILDLSKNNQINNFPQKDRNIQIQGQNFDNQLGQQVLHEQKQINNVESSQNYNSITKQSQIGYQNDGYSNSNNGVQNVANVNRQTGYQNSNSFSTSAAQGTLLETHHKTTHIYSWNNQWKESDICSSIKSSEFNVATLQTQSGPTPIYIYDEISDKWVSANLKKYGSWEREIAVSMVEVFRRFPGMALVDIGANLGVFSLEIAKLGRRVIAVEPLVSNIQRLCSSIKVGGYNNSVTMVYNAVSEKHEKVTLGKDLNNVGGTFVNKDNAQKISQSVVSGVYAGTVNTILLDDLLSLPVAMPTQVTMKIDVEGYEVHVIKGGDKFFESVDVRAVFMEWTYSNNPTIVETVLNFMKKHKMLPYDLSLRTNYINKDVKLWPGTVVWLKQS